MSITADLKLIVRNFLGSGILAPEAAPVDPDVAPPPELLTSLLADERVPKNSREKAALVLSTIQCVVGRLHPEGAFDPRATELDRLRTIDLAQLLQRYVDIPAEHRAEIFRRTEKSASYHLAAALDVIANRVAEISLDLAAGPIDEFTTRARFVESRYGHADDPFA